MVVHGGGIGQSQVRAQRRSRPLLDQMLSTEAVHSAAVPYCSADTEVGHMVCVVCATGHASQADCKS
jgi:hypothetical protein